MPLPFFNQTIGADEVRTVFEAPADGAPYRSAVIVCEASSPTPVEFNVPAIHGATWHKLAPGNSIEIRRSRQVGSGASLRGLDKLQLRAVGGNAIATVLPTE